MKKYPTRIKFITTSFPKFPGDSHAPWILSIAEKLVNKGYDLEVITPSANDLKQREIFGKIKVKRFRYFLKNMENVAYGANIPANLSQSNIAKLIFPFFLVGFLIEAIRSLKNVDIIHAQFGYSGLFIAIAHYLKNSKIRFFVSFYGRDVAHAKKYKFLYRFLFWRANTIFVLSEDMKKQLINCGCNKDKLKVLHLGVDCDVFKNENHEEKDKKDKILFLVVANFVKKKGIQNIIKAFSKLNKLSFDSELRIVGRGPLENKLRAQVKNLKIEEKVKFINNYQLENPRNYVIQSMSEADIFILPGFISKDDYGGTPIVLMEAGSMQLPSITANNAGNSEIVLNGETGIVLENLNTTEMVKAMNFLIENNQIRREFGLNARKYIFENFNLNYQVDKLINFYK